MKYIIPVLFVVLISCNSSNEKADTIAIDHQSLDSLVMASDSLNARLASLDTLATKAYFVTRSEIQKLRKEKKELTEQLEKQYPNFQSIQSDDQHLKRINELNALLTQKEFENAKLRRRIYYDSLYGSRGQILQEPKQQYDQVVYPSSNSLVITLDKQIKGDGYIPEQAIGGVYIIPYNKKSKKIKGYGDCNMAELNKLNSQRAIYYNGKYFFNDLRPGKYIVKVCSYYGDYLVINKDDNYHEIKMKVASPIQ